MNKIKIFFTVPGAPVAQGRARFTTKNGYAGAYDPEKSRDYKNYIRLAAAKEMAGRPPLEGALCLNVAILRPIPKSFSKKKVELAVRGAISPVTRPDVSNYIKLIEDACNGIIWQDDSQITFLICGKYYSHQPRVEIMVSNLDGTEREAGRE